MGAGESAASESESASEEEGSLSRESGRVPVLSEVKGIERRSEPRLCTKPHEVNGLAVQTVLMFKINGL